MVPVSQQWKNVQRDYLVPEAFVEISFRIGNPDAQSDATVTSNGSESFCNPQEIVMETANPIKYAMLEPGLWVLDGTYRIVGGSIETPVGENEGFLPAGEIACMKTKDGEEFYSKVV